MATKKTAKAKAKKKSAPKLEKNDIVRLIMDDHKPLKKLIRVLKSDNKELEEKRAAFEEFAPLLLNHAKPEEQALYMKMRNEEELRSESFEAETEHQIAERLLNEIMAAQDEDMWEAKVKVLAELVEHHIEEEEEEMLKDVKKEFETAQRVEMGEEFLRLKEQGIPAMRDLPDAEAEDIAA